MDREHLGYIYSRLAEGRRMQYALTLCAVLAVPMLIFVEISDGIEFILLALIGAVMMKKLNTPDCVPFVLPLTLLTIFGFAFDVSVLVLFLLHTRFPGFITIALIALALSVRTVMLQRLIPISRLIIGEGTSSPPPAESMLLTRTAHEATVVHLSTPPHETI